MIKSLPTGKEIENELRLQQYRSVPNWDRLYMVLERRYDALRDFLLSMNRKLWSLADAEGLQLDNIGRIHGIPRPNRSFDDLGYRSFLREEIMRSNSGTFSEILDWLILKTGDPDAVLLQEHPHGSLVAFTPNGAVASRQALQSFTVAGVLALVGSYFWMRCWESEESEEENEESEEDVLVFADGSIWLLAGEEETQAEIIFQIYFFLSRNIDSADFQFSVNGVKSIAGATDLIRYNLSGEVHWRFISLNPVYQNTEGTFDIIPDTYIYDVFVEVEFANYAIATEDYELLQTEDYIVLMGE